ncbi:MAG TPA: hypothetical protein DEQ47_02630 [Solibacterales bacterium]|nr:hypothetical protein [Bryobacterales bacterium]
MRSAAGIFTAICLSFASSVQASDIVDKAQQAERAGDPTQAESILAKAASQSRDVEVRRAYAEFLDRYDEAGTRAAYRSYLELAPTPSPEAEQALRRLALLDSIAGDRAAYDADLAQYRAAGGHDWPAAQAMIEHKPAATVLIPGPLRSFARMAALSQELPPDELLPALARNIVTNGYQASRNNESLEQTEYLKLVFRYLTQARELSKLADKEHVIRIATCESAQTGELLRVLGFRMRGGCGSEVVLETVNAARAFLATDSGFPLTELELALRNDKPFAYDFAPTPVPLLYSADYWISSKEKDSSDFLDAMLGDPSLARFYLGMAKLDRTTADQLKATVAMPKLRAYAHVLDFFGGLFEIQNGRAVVPGGPRAATTWGEMAGVSPEKGAQFFERLLAKDDGWLASLYDSLARIHGPVQAYLTDPVRLKRFYAAVRGLVTSPGPARPVFRANSDMMLLTTRLRLDPDGQAHVPGGLELWKALFSGRAMGKLDARLAKSAPQWKHSDDLLEALFALSRKSVDNEPLKVFMALGDMDRYRAKPLAPDTAERLALNYAEMGSQYNLFCETPDVSDATIVAFLDSAASIDHIHDTMLRQNAAATLQALAGLWQVLARQGELQPARADAALASIVKAFAEIKNPRMVFDAGRGGIQALLDAARPDAARGSGGAPRQERVLALLAGGAAAGDSDAHGQLVQEMQKILDAQRIVPLDVLTQVADSLDHAIDPALMRRLMGRISEVQLPRAALSAAEKNALAFGYWTDKHIEAERKLNLAAAIERAGKDPEKLKEVRGLLAPLLRDTLVAYNYARYAPPGAQILYTNPLFVRAHDFVGLQQGNHIWKSAEMYGTGWPSNGGGRLVGSLSNLPYALAEAEQNFLVPTQTQALIWGDLAPQMILGAKVPRFWDVTPTQLHWVGLHMRFGQALLAEAALRPETRVQLLGALNLLATPARTMAVADDLAIGNVKGAMERLTPAELYVVADELLKTPVAAQDVAGRELLRLQHDAAADVSDAAISRAFGTPKPTLANSYRPELLRLRTFPTLMGYSSRILAESWESNALYWAALADQIHATPGQLNVLVPEWTQKVVERIFASNLEDWPALLGSLRLVGADIRKGGHPEVAGLSGNGATGE